MLAGIAVILSQTGGYDFEVAVALSASIACTCVVMLARSFRRRDRPLRFRAPTTAVILVLGWLAVFSVTFFFLYYPQAAWRTS